MKKESGRRVLELFSIPAGFSEAALQDADSIISMDHEVRRVVDIDVEPAFV
ncbi:MAG: hypothetical protein OK422_06655 [Thaumarchaeota archaeon]|nr:hypothetical protein [Nitrososphaerota archaeon]